MASVGIHDVRKAFGATEVLHGVSIDIADGEFVVLVGPSGCGKSTLLRMIAGLETVSAGDIRIGDRRVNDVPPKDRDIAMVFQSYALYPHLTVFENMAFSLRIRRAAQAEVEQRVRAAADMLGLASFLERYPRQLSGGQRQRVAMGRAVVRAPQLFLFDEPLSNLDAKLRVAMRTEIKELHRRVGGTTIYVTHDQIEAMTMADRIVVMQNGNIEQVGPPLELYDSPTNVFVAGFIGSPAMNFLSGIVRRQSGPMLKTSVGALLTLPDRPGLEDGRTVTLGLRPEGVSLVGDGEGFPIDVVVVEPTGAEVQVVAKHGAADFVAVFRERLDARSGQQLRIQADLERAHVFDTQTGIAIRA